MSIQLKRLFYYLLFISSYTGLYFVSSLYIMSYEDNYDPATGEQWYSVASMDTDELIAYCVWWIASFPVGYIGKSGLIAFVMHCLVNPLVVAWMLLFFLKKHEQNIIRYSIAVNAIITLFVFLFFIYQAMRPFN